MFSLLFFHDSFPPGYSPIFVFFCIFTPPFSKLGKVKTYVGEDGKLHFVDSEGADTVIPFNGYGQFKVIRCDSVSNGSFDGYECYFEEDGVIVIYQIALQNWWDALPKLSGHKNLVVNSSSQSNAICYIIAEVEKGKTLTVTGSGPGGSGHSGYRIVVMATGVTFN